jgi:hypothetical protein
LIPKRRLFLKRIGQELRRFDQRSQIAAFARLSYFAAKGTGKHADESDADLDRAEKLLGLLRQLQRQRGTFVSFSGTLLEPSFA